MNSDVKAYVLGCDTCSRRKHPIKTKQAPMQLVQSGNPIERLATDILGELPLTEKGNKYILVVSDYFTKWTEAFPMPNMEAVTVAQLIVEEVVARFGVPCEIHSDQGRQYESKLFAEVCSLLNIRKTRTTPYHPKSDGMVERFNKTLVTMLSAYVHENQRDWDKHLPYVMMAYRAAEHETTGFTPNRLMLGRETATPLDLIYEMPHTIKSMPTHRWAWEVKERLEEAHKLVRTNTQSAMRRQKRYHDSRTAWEKFSPGDSVYVFFPVKKSGQSGKLSSFWKGPFKIKSKVSDVLYDIDCGRNGSNQVIHCDRVRKQRPQVLRDECFVVPDSESFQDDGVDKSLERLADEVRVDSTSGQQVVTRYGRQSKRPVWLQDYE